MGNTLFTQLDPERDKKVSLCRRRGCYDVDNELSLNNKKLCLSENVGFKGNKYVNVCKFKVNISFKINRVFGDTLKKHSLSSFFVTH